jgi:DNA repair exonuclease SbcCD ATPase subunit
MAVKKNEEPKVTDDVKIIRQILFGEHLEMLGAKLDRLENSVAEIREALDKETKARLADRAKESTQVRDVHKDLKGELDKLNLKFDEEVEKNGENQRKAIDRLNRKVDRIIRQVRKDMSGHESQLENLVGSLASALTAYRISGEDTPE